MEIEPLEEEFKSLGSGIPRTPSNGCLHLTEVIDGIEREMGWEYKGDGFGDGEACMDLGFTWERMLELAYVDRAGVRVGEVTKDGIIGSPDGIGLDPISGSLALFEFKCTWKSTKKTPDKIWRYITQVKSYCTMLNLEICIMRILYVVGDHWGHGPQYRPFRITFDRVELAENWEMILNQRDRMRKT